MNTQAYETGYTDYIVWGEKCENPFDKDHIKYEEWEEGFYTALGEAVAYSYWENLDNVED